MTERRPHWDDELIESLPIPGHSYLEDEDIYAIIAAVEDWVLSAPIFDLYLSRKHAPDRAAIQRVRDACVSSHVDDKGKKVVFLDRIQRALDGGDAEPELDISISSYAKEADDGEVGWNDGGDA